MQPNGFLVEMNSEVARRIILGKEKKYTGMVRQV